MNQGKTIIVTGASSGIGLAAARRLAAAGAAVVMVSRDPARGEAARQLVAEQASGPDPVFLAADLSSQQAIRNVAAWVRERYGHIDALLNNAGTASRRRELTVDGLEKTFATNHLTEQLHPRAVRAVMTDELITSLPMLLRLPRRIDRIGASLQSGHLGLNVRLLADDRDRHYLTDLVHLILLTILAATAGIIGVLILGLRDGPRVTGTLTLDQCLGYGLLVIAAVLALRVLLAVLRTSPT